MGRLFVREYDQTPDSRFFICGTCNTRITKLDDWIAAVGFPTFEMLIDPPEHHYDDHSYESSNIYTRVAKVHCVVWNVDLGKRFVQVDPPIVREGGFLFQMPKLGYWNAKNLTNIVIAQRPQRQRIGQSQDNTRGLV